MPLFLRAAWTSFTLSFDIRWPEPDRADDCALVPESRCVCMSLLVPRWLLLPLAEGSDFCEPD